MTANVRCEDVTARLLELLYDELPADERAALQAHIAGCARCQAEVQSFQKTRAVARSVLADPAPAGVRQRLIAAAMAASASAPAAKPAAAPASDGGGGFWAWLRQRWTLPTLATVGAMAVFLLASRVFLNPDKTYQRGQEIAAPAASPPPAAVAPALAAPPSASDQRFAPASSRERVEAASAKPPPEARHRAAETGKRGQGGHAQVTANAPTPPADKAAPAPATRAPEHQMKAKTVAREALDDLLEADRSAPVAKPAKRSAAPVGGVLEQESPSEAFSEGAGPGKGASAAGGVGSAAGAARLAEPFPATVERSRRDESRAAPPSRPAARPAPPPAAAPAAPAAAAPPPAVESAVRAEAKKSAAEESLPQRAERLYREHRWPEAAAAYEQLLQQFPKSPLVSQWRQRLSIARAGGPPPAAQPVSDEPAR